MRKWSSRNSSAMLRATLMPWARLASAPTCPPDSARNGDRGNRCASGSRTPDPLLAILRNRGEGAAEGSRRVAAATPVAAQPAAQPAALIASGKAKPGDDRFIALKARARPNSPPRPHRSPNRRQNRPRRPPSPRKWSSAAKYVVQVGAFSSESRANAAAKSVGGSVARAGKLWRVRVCPFASEADAQGALGKAKAKGFRDAVVQRDR